MEYDPYDQAVLEDPYPFYRFLREEAPLYHNERLNIRFLSRYADVRRALLDPRTFSSAHGLFLDVNPERLVRDMLQTDPPRHERLRKLVLEGFTPRRISRMEPRLREIVGGLLDEIAPRGESDLVADYAWPFPAMVICELVGVPDEDRPAFRDWAHELATGAAAGDDSIYDAANRIYAYFDDLIATRRRRPSSDLVSALIDARIDGESLSHEELLGFCFLFLVAGHETTANAIGNSVLLLHRQPELRERLRRERALLPAAVEEFLRLESPTQGLSRTLLRDVELHEHKLREGDKVHLLFAAANRDPAVFDRADDVDLSRDPNPHLAFGQGIHFCLGARLARLELRLALDALLERLPDFEITALQVQRLASPIIRGVEALPVRFTPSG